MKIKESKTFNPPHISSSVNQSKMLEKEYLMSLAAKANHLTENLVGIRASSHARNNKISNTSNLLTHQRQQSLITSMGNKIKESEF